MTNEKQHNRPKYSLEFRQDAAKLVLEKGYSQQQAADHLGVSLSAMRRWVRAERKPSASDATMKKNSVNLGEHDELIRLRKENEQLRMEREILKKAAVFFAKEAEYPQGTSKVRVYSRAREDVSSDRTVSSDAGEYQRLLRLVKSPERR
ncbi:transposase [Methylomonas sp. BW4-1]|uniref:transposase n=1 Tax=Methylomonas sp. BW4-1 TaxID=3376685 RepID=UPI004041A7FA